MAIVLSPLTISARFFGLLQRARGVLPNAQNSREPMDKYEFFVTSGHAFAAWQHCVMALLCRCSICPIFIPTEHAGRQ
jgi:hypothetical protein